MITRHALKPPLRGINIAATRYEARRAHMEHVRTEYLTWLIHFYGEQLTALELFEKMQDMTLQQIETLMKLRLLKIEGQKSQKKREEEERQKKLLERLKLAK